MMKIRKWKLMHLVLLGVTLGAGGAKADTTLADFNGTGFDYCYGSWGANCEAVSTGPSFATIAGSANEMGGAGVNFGSLKDLSGLGVALTAQSGAANKATEFQVALIDSQERRAVYAFPSSGLNAFSMNTLFLPTPTFAIDKVGAPIALGDVDLTKISGFALAGNFSSDKALSVSVDKVAAVSSPPPVPEPGTFSLWGTGLLGVLAVLLLRRRSTAA